MEAIQPELLLSLFQQPGLLLIGIDPETHHALVWSGRQAAAVDAADLVQVIIGAGPLTPSTMAGQQNGTRHNTLSSSSTVASTTKAGRPSPAT